MTVVNADALAEAARKNKPLQKVLDRWLQVAERADWRSLRDVRLTFPTADGVMVKTAGSQLVATVFNVKGNEFRLITIDNYSAATILICDLLAHAEYSKNRWKDRL